MAIVQFDPFEEMRALQKQFFNDDWWSPRNNKMQLPTTDIYTDDDKSMVIESHLPYFSEDDIEISNDRGMLTISAEKHEKEEDKNKKYVLRESSSSFYRRIALPKHADAENIHASFNDGVLKVHVPYKELPSPKKIAISSKTGKSASKGK